MFVFEQKEYAWERIVGLCQFQSGLKLSTSAGYLWLTTGIPMGKPGMETCGSELLMITGLHRSGCLFWVLWVLTTSTWKIKIFFNFLLI